MKRTLGVVWREMPDLHSPVKVTVLNSAKAISVLLDSRQRAAFLPFLSREVSVSQAALEVSELPNTMLYRVKRWQRLGLLLEMGCTRHAKGVKRLYRATADAYFVPHSATSAEDLLTLAHNIHAPLFSDFLQAYVQSGQALSDHWGVRFERKGEHWSVRPSKAVDDDCEPTDLVAPPSMVEYLQMQLCEAQAKAMQLELWAVLERYANQSSVQGKTYRVILGIA